MLGDLNLKAKKATLRGKKAQKKINNNFLIKLSAISVQKSNYIAPPIGYFLKILIYLRFTYLTKFRTQKLSNFR